MGARVGSAPSVICIGGSAGALIPAADIVGALPGDFGVPIVVCIHRGMPTSVVRTSHAVAYLNRVSALTVSEIDDLDDLAPGIHVAPAGYHTLVTEESLILSAEPPVSYSMPSIDVLFESAADSHGPGSVAVVLSCANTDGSTGAKRIRSVGGTIIAQDPATAEHTNLIDAVIGSGGTTMKNPADIGRHLAMICHSSASRSDGS